MGQAISSGGLSSGGYAAADVLCDHCSLDAGVSGGNAQCQMADMPCGRGVLELDGCCTLLGWGEGRWLAVRQVCGCLWKADSSRLHDEQWNQIVGEVGADIEDVGPSPCASHLDVEDAGCDGQRFHDTVDGLAKLTIVQKLIVGIDAVP
ncbi:hypothetical protein [Streptomyces sp. NPDC058739]|uniref:hypothetical protein n=1 Tax=Streptomyces sp. NPDC058739 TaxID=3346618 RepID=UPI0036BB857E